MNASLSQGSRFVVIAFGQSRRDCKGNREEAKESYVSRRTGLGVSEPPPAKQSKTSNPCLSPLVPSGRQGTDSASRGSSTFYGGDASHRVAVRDEKIGAMEEALGAVQRVPGWGREPYRRGQRTKRRKERPPTHCPAD